MCPRAAAGTPASIHGINIQTQSSQTVWTVVCAVVVVVVLADEAQLARGTTNLSMCKPITCLHVRITTHTDISLEC